MTRWQKIACILILLFAIALRFWRLGDIPEGFHSDEAAFGYNAYSILKTGKDEYGAFFPLTLQSFGDYKAALYAYLTIPPIYFFGLNEFAVRFPSAFFGVLFVIVTYVFVFFMTKQRSYSFIAMVLASCSPLPLLLSRVQSDPFVSVFFLLIGATCFFLWKEKKHTIYLIGMISFWLCSMFTYVLPRVFLLGFIPLLWIFFRHELSKRQQKTISITFGLLMIVTIGTSLFFSRARLQQVSVFDSPEVLLSLEENIREDGVSHAPMLVTRAYHNKPFEYSRFLVRNYFQHLSFDFLYGEANQPIREKIPHVGAFLLIELPFLLIGIYTVIRKKYQWGIFCLMWAFTVPAMISFTRDEIPNIHRFFFAVTPFHILTAVGVVHVYTCIKKQYRVSFIFILSVLFIFNVYYLLHNLFIHQPVHFPFYRGYAYKPLVYKTKEVAEGYDVIVSQKVLEHMLFFWPMDPKVYQDMGSPRDEDDHWMGKYLFVPIPCPSHSDKYISMMEGKKVLYMDKAECQESSDDILETIRWRDGSAAFYLVELNKEEL